MDLAMKCIKGGLAFALAGVLIALALPTVCAALGFNGDFVKDVAASQTVPWCSTFFGMIGATQPVTIAAVNAVLPEKKAAPQGVTTPELSLMPAGAGITVSPTFSPRKVQRAFEQDSSQGHSTPSTHVTDGITSGQVRMRGIPEQQL
jgi:hypothetical protein